MIYEIRACLIMNSLSSSTVLLTIFRVGRVDLLHSFQKKGEDNTAMGISVILTIHTIPGGIVV